MEHNEDIWFTVCKME